MLVRVKDSMLNPVPSERSRAGSVSLIPVRADHEDLFKFVFASSSSLDKVEGYAYT